VNQPAGARCDTAIGTDVPLSPSQPALRSSAPTPPRRFECYTIELFQAIKASPLEAAVLKARSFMRPDCCWFEEPIRNNLPKPSVASAAGLGLRQTGEMQQQCLSSLPVFDGVMW